MAIGAAIRTRRDALNLSSLYFSLAFNAIVNLALIAYLARVLQPETWGLVLFAQAVGLWLAMIPEYGFPLSGGRAIAQAENGRQVARIANSVNASKVLLALPILPICGIAFFAIPGFAQQPSFLIGAGLYAIAQGFDPIWLFQGAERQYLYAIISSAARALLLALTFLLIDGPEDGSRYMYIQAMAAAGVFLAGWTYLRRAFPRERVGIGDVTATLRQNWHTFQFRGVQALMTNSSIVILGIVSPVGVQTFGSAERIVRNCLGLLGPISAAGLPRIARLVRSDMGAARRTARLSFLIMVGFGILIATMLLVLAPLIVTILLGDGYAFVIPVLRIVALALPFAATSTMLGIQWMLPLGLDRILVKVTLVAGILNVIGCIVLGSIYSAVGVAVTMVAAEAVLMAGILLALWRRGQLTFLR